MNKNRSRLPVAITSASSLLLLTGCSPEMQRGFLPDSAGVTNNTDTVIGLWTTSWIVLLLVGAVSWALMAWALIVYRRRKGETEMPAQLRYNLPIETLFTVIPLILVMGFFAFTARDMSLIENPVEDPDVRIEVVAKQWSWDFNYVDDNVYFSGIQAQVVGPDPDVLSKLPSLYLPVGKSIQIKLNSRDVIHSFWVVDFLYKKDMFPGHTNYMYFTPLKEGTYVGKCAELCGEYHSMMLFNVKVVSVAEYERQMGQLAVAGNIGQLSGEFDRNQNLPGGNVTRED